MDSRGNTEDTPTTLPGAGLQWTWKSFAIVPGLLFLLVCAAWIISRQPFSQAYQARTEEGFIEWITVVLYGIAAILAFVLWIRQGRPGILLCAAVLIILMGLRELDFHERFTGEKISSIRYWRSGEELLIGKIAYLSAIALLVYVLVKLFREIAPVMLIAWRQKRSLPIILAGIPLFAGISFIIDNQLETEFIDKATEITESHRLVLFFSLSEETIEAGIPILIMLALIGWVRMGNESAAAEKGES